MTLLKQNYKDRAVSNTSHLATDLVSTVAASATRSGLRSGNTTNCCLPRLQTKFGERASSSAGPAAWNRLPQNIRASTSLNGFKRKLKTHLFTEAFN